MCITASVKYWIQFCAQNAAYLKQLQGYTNLAWQLTHGHIHGGECMKAGQLRYEKKPLRLDAHWIGLQIFKNVYRSPEYWKQELYGVLAMLKVIGVPTWFLTLSAADFHWPKWYKQWAFKLERNLSRMKF